MLHTWAGDRSVRTCVRPQLTELASRAVTYRRQPYASAIYSTHPSNDNAGGANLDDTGLQDTSDAFLRELANKPGVRIVLPDDPGYRQVGGYEDDEDEEDWDEVMSELTDPWMLEPQAGNDMLEPSSPLAATTAVDALKMETVEIQNQEQLQQLFKDTPQVAVVDVRSQEEWDQGHLPNSIHCPIQQLTGDTAKQLATLPILILGTGDHRGGQACTRLTKVYGALNVYYYEDGLAAWPASITTQEQQLS